MKHSIIAADAGISPETLSRVLSGVHRRPSIETVVRITRATGHTVAWLFGEPGHFSPGELAQLRKAAVIIEAASRPE